MAQTTLTTRLSPTPPDCGARVGDLVGGRFRLRAVVGWGGQAVVFRAADARRANAETALKIVRRDLPAADQREAADLLRWEAGLLRRLRHPALPRLIAAEQAAGAAWLARELAAGAALSQHGPQPPATVARWALLLCDLLIYLHSRPVPVIAGDLKPANLVLRPDGGLTLIDLGAATTLTRRPPRQPRPRHGTPGYAPPEQLGGHSLDERSDLFSLAVTCYELLTGLDPALAPLQLDLGQLDAAAPALAPALRWALALDREQRCPSAATLRHRLGVTAPPPPLPLGLGVGLRDTGDLGRIIAHQPGLLEPAVASGDLDRWLAGHPDPTMARLRYRLRELRRDPPPAGRPLDLLLTALAPPEGSPLLRAAPALIDFGPTPPLRSRLRGRAQALTLHNTALTPLAWQIDCPPQPGADIRVLHGGRPQRAAAGVVAPGQRLAIELAALAAAGPQQGAIELRCGQFSQRIPWRAEGRAGVPLGDQILRRLEDLDPARPGVVPALERLLATGRLGAWLRALRQRALAADVERQAAAATDELGRLLIVGRLLHQIAPADFPSLRIGGVAEAAERPLVAGQPQRLALLVDNLSAQRYPLRWRTRCAWAYVEAGALDLAPLAAVPALVTLSPPAGLSGPQPVALELQIGALTLPVVLQVTVGAERWWQRLRRMLGG